MQRASTSSGSTPRASASSRDALLSLLPTEEERDHLYSAVREVLRGRGRSRREAEEALLGNGRVPPALLIPLVLAVRDELQREEPPPRGLAGRVDGLLTAIASVPDRPVRSRSRAPGRRRAIGDKAGRLPNDLLELAPDAVLTIRASGEIGIWNRSGTEITGRRRRDVVRDGARSLFRQPEDLEALLRALETKGRVDPRETVLARASGEDVPVRIYAARVDLPLTSPEDPERHLLLIHDLTELHNIRSRLIETEKLSAMAKIAGSVAHEFRNPLNSLFLSTDLLEDELSGSGAPEKAIAPTLEAIREEIERLNQIITHYLSLSKAASNAPERLDFGVVVGEFAEEFQERAAELGIDLRVRVHEGDLFVIADPNQVRRVLVNVVENAFDALADTSASTRDRGPSGKVTLVVRPMRRTVKLVIRDNGPGIAEELRERVFEPFFTSKSQGSGLGLYLVREIVLAHGGAITLASTGGRGTSVAMHWPRPGGEDA